MPTHVPLQTATPTPRPQSTDHPSRLAKPAQKKGAERVPRLLGSVSYRLLLGICGSQITGLSTRGPLPYPERGGSGPASRPLGASVFAGQATLVPRPNLVSHSVGGGASAVGAVGFGSCCWGAASADDVVVAPFWLIPSSFEVEEPSFSMSSTSIPSTSGNSPDKCAYHRIFVADPILTQNAPTIYPNPFQTPFLDSTPAHEQQTSHPPKTFDNSSTQHSPTETPAR